MSHKQINKTLILEGIFYGLDSIFYGILFSLLILFGTSKFMQIDSNMYLSKNLFEVPWLNIFISIITIYIIIFLAIFSSKKKFINNNIIDEIENESI